MKNLIFLFTICVLCRFIDGQTIKENLNIGRDSGDDHQGIEDKEEGRYESAKESIEVQENEDDDNGSKKNEDATLESNVGSPTQEDETQGLISGSKEEEKRKKQFKDNMKRYLDEMEAGDTADLIGQNPHVRQDHMYDDLSRRFIPQYKYTGGFENTAPDVDENELIPEKAPPELVLVVAKESALLGKQKESGRDVEQKTSLRSGDYWNGVWKEDIDAESALRSSPRRKILGSIKAEIKPGSEFYKMVSKMKKISPRLLYIINKKQI